MAVESTPFAIEGKQIKIHYQGACGAAQFHHRNLQYIEQFLKEAISPELEVQAN
ncbi:MAG: hypothetical protein CM1200mP16_16690 [Nitrospina sp.]|nr:MAG: hypothetical protein CM1200mP16_16690 [Nitrospina sp.]